MGEELRACRRARGIPRAALAQALATRPVIIGRWERGEAVPNPDQARALAALLDLPAEAAADWLSAAEQVEAEADRGWRLPGRGSARWPSSGAAGTVPGPKPAAGPRSYLDDRGERRRYLLRWALTLAILGALAIGLMWALGELGDGWRAVVDLWRDNSPADDLTGAWGLLQVN
jgi:transcriptional regulator with XRE-family HTH domain